MENFVYQNRTKVIFGEKKYLEIIHYLNQNKINKILIIYGKNAIKKIGLYDEITNLFSENSIEFYELSGVQSNPILSKVHEGIELVKKNNVELILAIGGGSVIDTAKAVSIGALYDGDVWDFYERKEEINSKLPLYVILTLSATGSEVNGRSVITNTEKKLKWSVRSEILYPEISFIDPSLQYEVTGNQLIDSACDIISHVLEFYFDNTQNSLLMDEISEGIIRTVMISTEKLLENSKDYNYRSQFSWAASLALNEMLNCGKNGGDWSSHKIEHALSAYNDISHGKGLAIILPAWMKYVYKFNSQKFQRFAEKIFGITEKDELKSSLIGIQELQNWFKKIGQTIYLNEIEIKEEELKTIAKIAEKQLPYGNIKKLNFFDIIEILKLAYKN